MLEISHLAKSYKNAVVYTDFSFTVQDGEITCILGESGSGKTTLLNCIAGITGYSGSISACRCSYIFQSPRLVPSLTVLGNLKLVCPDEGRIMRMLEAVGLGDRAKSYPGKLSGGQQQRVAIARAFLYDADVILMDEPFSSLDLKTKDEMVRLFFSVWEKERRTVLLVTHDADDALAMAERIVVLKCGDICLDLRMEGRPPRGIGSCERERVQLVKALME
ncbi:MAG: ABC transporter ATP-binding protein [Clostridia bacterium]|nr:ABC transporter ATP-binding protein [Clostridia bacterium]